MQHYDVIVIGGGHAGAEAATMAARSGVRTLLVTQQLESIGQMSCNPAIGGIAKGTVAREVDALGGIMGRATDRASIQFRMLNRSKGPAVWSPRAQCDRALYRRAVRALLEQQPNLDFLQGTVAGLSLKGKRVAGIVLQDGSVIPAGVVVLTAGTFLCGRIHLGTDTQIPAGRAGEPPSVELSQVIQSHGLTAKRFKTGTPPRIDGRSAQLDRLVQQNGEGPSRFSFHERATALPQLPCYLTWAGPEVKEVIQRHLEDSALYGGAISGRGPRYCPSVEDKIVKFPDAERHQVFLEPEGLDTAEMYVNGLSTSLPPRVQLEFLRLVPGLEQVHMTRPGYAIEYDYFPPTQLSPSLEVRTIPGLFFAGQINGTTGYEEAAGQGVLAGINAAAVIRGIEPLVLRRDEAFLGVLADDLVTRGVDEPYRLFTSRAEYRLLLRQDNALRRLLPVAESRGLLTNHELRSAHARLRDEERIRELGRETAIRPELANPILEAAGGKPINQPTRAQALARRPGVPLAALLSEIGGIDEELTQWAEIEFKYEGYLNREREAAARLGELEDFALPEELAYAEITTISIEAREKLDRIRPQTLGQAGRVPGISPSDLHSLVTRVARLKRD
ncbi:MAG TPA: tRNA uridine-5-carboxymethylaminomethyl(34) synthesis enzyme MnmG [Gemmatimonadales bacterium]|nr:tRNA uridine-5-carboxymethylaminomethyl(34) synthesis enzyme MnmG [Gemmatimonadales bacterium]